MCGRLLAIRRLGPLTFLFAFLCILPGAYGATITVGTTADAITDDGSCSLREAIIAANTNASVDNCPAGSAILVDVIILPPGVYTLTIAGTNENQAMTGDLDLTDSAGIAIIGDGSDTTIIDGAQIDRVLESRDGSLSLTNLTI